MQVRSASEEQTKEATTEITRADENIADKKRALYLLDSLLYDTMFNEDEKQALADTYYELAYEAMNQNKSKKIKGREHLNLKGRDAPKSPGQLYERIAQVNRLRGLYRDVRVELEKYLDELELQRNDSRDALVGEDFVVSVGPSTETSLYFRRVLEQGFESSSTESCVDSLASNLSKKGPHLKLEFKHSERSRGFRRGASTNAPEGGSPTQLDPSETSTRTDFGTDSKSFARIMHDMVVALVLAMSRNNAAGRDAAIADGRHRAYNQVQEDNARKSINALKYAVATTPSDRMITLDNYKPTAADTLRLYNCRSAIDLLELVMELEFFSVDSSA